MSVEAIQPMVCGICGIESARSYSGGWVHLAISRDAEEHGVDPISLVQYAAERSARARAQEVTIARGVAQRLRVRMAAPEALGMVWDENARAAVALLDEIERLER